MKFPVTMHRDEDGVFVVGCPVVPGCMSQGETEVEALENIREAIPLCLEARRDEGFPLTIELHEVDVPLPL